MAYQKPVEKKKKKEWKRKKNKTRQELEEENLTYYEREFLKRREEYIGSEQWKKDCLAVLRRLYQQGKNLSVSENLNPWGSYESLLNFIRHKVVTM